MMRHHPEVVCVIVHGERRSEMESIRETPNGVKHVVLSSGRTACMYESVNLLLNQLHTEWERHDYVEHLNRVDWVGRDIGQGEGKSGKQAKKILLKTTETGGACWNAEKRDLDLIKSIGDEFNRSLANLGEIDLSPKAIWTEYRGKVNARRRLEGATNFRRTRRPRPKDGRAIRIIIDIGQNSDVDKERGFMRAAAGLAACAFLERQGLKVELWAAEDADGIWREVPEGHQHNDHLTLWRVKSSQQRLNLSTLANTCGTWFFRSIIFQAFSMLTADGFKVKSSLGRSVVPKREDIAELLGTDRFHFMTASVRGGVEEAKTNAIKAAKDIIEKALKESFGNMGSNRYHNTEAFV